MVRVLGNSGAPRWYDCDSGRFRDYLDLLQESGASGAEVVLHDGDADEFTSRVHVLRADWERVIRGYRDCQLHVTVHGPLTPEFSPMRWRNEPAGTLKRYQPILRQVAELARHQGRTTIVLHAVADANAGLAENERNTARFLEAMSAELARWSTSVDVALEVRAYRLSRPTAAGTTRESVMRIVDQVEDPRVGVCWDVAHDLETRNALDQSWEDPTEDFLRLVRHVHVHDLGPGDEPHYPPLIGRVPVQRALELTKGVAATMEVRWRMAERLGDPWDVLKQSYRAVMASSRS